MKERRKLNKNTNVAANSITAYGCHKVCQCDISCGGGSYTGMKANTISSTTVSA